MERVLDVYRHDASFSVVCMGETPRRQCLSRRIDSIDILRTEVAAWKAARDRNRAKVDGQFTTEDARVKLKRLYPTFDE